MTDDEMIKLYEAEIMNDPDAYTREGECVYQITRTELIAAGRALQAATRDTASADSVDAKEAQEMLHGLDGSQYGLQFGDGSVRKGRSLRPNEMAIIRKGLKLLAASAPSADAVDAIAVKASCSPQTVFSAAQWSWIRHELKQVAIAASAPKEST